MNCPAWRVLADGLRFPEGPAFAADGALWCVELKGKSLVRFGVAGPPERIDVGGMPNGLVFDTAGRAVFCDSGMNALRRYDASDGSLATLADGLFGPNDLCFDAAGTLIFTCPGDSRWEPTGYVAALRPDGSVQRIGERMYFPNGLALTPDGRTLIVAETYRQRLWKGNWDGSCWRDAHPWAAVGDRLERPDGIAFGPDGRLYVAVYGTGLVKAIGMDGEILQEIHVPGQNPTNLAFGPSGRLGMVVTEAEQGRILVWKDDVS